IGLSTAILLAREGHRVTVLERDPAEPPELAPDAWVDWARTGVSQFRHMHVMLPRWYQDMRREIPDVIDELINAGAGQLNMVGMLPPSLTGGERPGDDRFDIVTARRPVLEAALAAVAALEARPLMMTTKAALADALERRGGSGDGSRARDLWTDAALLARELQLPDRARDYEAVLVGGIVREPGGLSAREADVLGLLATGASNQQIAEALHVSVKTVERHLSNLYRKLDVTNRTEAAAHALRRLGA
ncbi:MAG: LuxR C-terminal-related transcriptional regulator, partial [Acidimicrobiales bacterium]